MATGWMRRWRQVGGDGAGPAQRAAVMLKEAVRAADAGDPATAARLGDAAVGKLRELAASGTRGAEPLLILGLRSWSEQLSALSRQGEAVAAAQEAVALARAGSGAELALSLTALAARLVEASRVDEGREAAREALGIADLPPDPVLARLFTALAAALGRAGEPEAALAPRERALAIRRAVGRDDALALSGHADLLIAAGRWADAIEFSAEAVEHHRGTATTGELAAVLSRHAAMLRRVGREQEALAAAAEAAHLAAGT